MGRGGASAHYATQKATTSINELKTSKATKAAGKVSLAPPLKIKQALRSLQHTDANQAAPPQPRRFPTDKF